MVFLNPLASKYPFWRGVMYYEEELKALIKENVIEKIASCELDFMSWSDMELDLFNLTKVLCCTKIQMCGCKVQQFPAHLVHDMS